MRFVPFEPMQASKEICWQQSKDCFGSFSFMALSQNLYANLTVILFKIESSVALKY